ncbi:hypothetical protein [Mycoplasma struthionis]|uniref:Uncharacterized protein n=1 Tax=Mycoplasma struthionis TaxID=538220 RepID=A0A3G8LH67_9MOLU|nr:hypothetical protein [Mycoplasma struthionis]AZG68684.1 hypothetical protein EGN60_01735 [Mycoplasma struthionis]
MKTDTKLHSYVRNNLGVVREAILKANPDATKFANQVVDLLVRIIFKSDGTEKFIRPLIDSLLDLDEAAFKNINNFDDLIATLVSKNKEGIKSLIRSLMKDILTDQEFVKEAVKFTFGILNKSYNFTSTGIQMEDVYNFFTRVLVKFNQLNVVEQLLTKFVDLMADNFRILDAQGHFDKEKLQQKFISALRSIKYADYITSSNIREVLSTVLDDGLTKQQIENQLTSTYKYFVANKDKLQNITVAKESAAANNLAAPTENASAEAKQEFLKNLESLLFNILSGLNNSINRSNNNGKEGLTNFLYTVLKDQVKKIDWSSLKQKVIPQKRLQWITTKFIDYPEVRDIIKSVVNDFLAGDRITSTSLGDMLSKTIDRIKENLKNNFTNFLKKALADDEVLTAVVGDIFNYMKLENTDQADKDFAKNLIKQLLPKLVTTPLFQRKLLNRGLTVLSKKAKDFTLAEPTKWITEAIDEITKVFSMGDMAVLAQFIGEDNVINGPNLVKLINLLFGKSKLSDSLLYNALRNLNNDSNLSARTNMRTLNNFVSDAISSAFKSKRGTNNDPDNITVDFDPLATFNTIYRILAKEINKKKLTENGSFKVRAAQPEWKAVYRLNVAVDWIIFEMFGRESLVKDREKGPTLALYSGTRSILWELQEGTNLKFIPGIAAKFSGMATYFTSDWRRREFTNYIRDWYGGFFGLGARYYYYDENNYTPESIIYIIQSSGYNKNETTSRNTQFKYAVDENNKSKRVSKKDYIMMTLKEGGYGRFMKLNRKGGSSVWSGLANHHNPDDFF